MFSGFHNILTYVQITIKWLFRSTLIRDLRKKKEDFHEKKTKLTFQIILKLFAKINMMVAIKFLVESYLDYDPVCMVKPCNTSGCFQIFFITGYMK